MRRKNLALVAATLCWSSAAHAQYIGIFMDPEAASCAAQVGDHPWIDLHVIAVLEGSVTQVSGAQFRVTGAPSSWTPSNALWVPEPTSAISLGHPLFPSSIHPEIAGVNVAYSDCQVANRVLLGRIVLLGAPTPGEVHLRVDHFDLVPPDPDCPFVLGCWDPGMFEKLCVGGGEIVLNGPARASCQMAVQPSTWAGMKSLYRD